MPCMKPVLTFLLLGITAFAAPVKIPGLKANVEILRDRWGVPHIYAENTHDLFFAQGWITAKDRLFQIDLWRRIGTGKLAEALGPAYVKRDRMARLVRYRGNWDEEWSAYSPDAKEIAIAFTSGINAYIRSLDGYLPDEFAAARYKPDFWQPEDITARIAGLQMLRNARTEITRALEIKKFGIDAVQKYRDLDPPVKLVIPTGLDLSLLSEDMLADYEAAVGPVNINDGSNNWAVDGSRSVTGKPLLASDPHRALTVPSLRKTVHLVAPGWNIIGAGEPALPGIALGHNEEMAFGFTIVGIDQQDLYIEKLNPENPNQYRFKDQWLDMEVEKTEIAVKGSEPQILDLKYTRHGPVIYENARRGVAVSLRWVGAEPGGAGYLSALSLSRTKTWEEFKKAAASYKTPSENLVYADRAGNIGWIASGKSPLRKNWTGLLPVPGHTGEYEWEGYLNIDQHPQKYNPPEHWVGTANTNHLPAGYPHQLGYEFSPPFRFERIKQLFASKEKFSIEDFVRMQYDVTSVPAQQFQEVLKKWTPTGERNTRIKDRFLKWDRKISADSYEALVFELWMHYLPGRIFGDTYAPMTGWQLLLKTLEATPNHPALSPSLEMALLSIEKNLGPESEKWTWGQFHHILLQHPVNRSSFHIPSKPMPGDTHTVNAAGWSPSQLFRMSHGASYRQVMDTSDWDQSVITNSPGESGDPNSRNYKDLFEDWSSGKAHPLPYTRPAVEKALREKIELIPAN